MLPAATFLSVSLAALLLQADAGELKVFVLAGQSNMEGHAEVATINASTVNP